MAPASLYRCHHALLDLSLLRSINCLACCQVDGPHIALLGAHWQLWTQLLTCLQDGTQKSQKVFTNVPTEVGATEAEEIGGCCLLSTCCLTL